MYLVVASFPDLFHSPAPTNITCEFYLPKNGIYDVMMMSGGHSLDFLNMKRLLSIHTYKIKGQSDKFANAESALWKSRKVWG